MGFRARGSATIRAGAGRTVDLLASDPVSGLATPDGLSVATNLISQMGALSDAEAVDGYLV